MLYRLSFYSRNVALLRWQLNNEPENCQSDYLYSTQTQSEPNIHSQFLPPLPSSPLASQDKTQPPMNNKLFVSVPPKTPCFITRRLMGLMGPGLAIMHHFLLYPCIVCSMLDISSSSLALLDPGAALSHACYSQSFYVDIRMKCLTRMIY
jgi:hypothetical protein